MCRNNVQLLQLATPLTMTNTGVCDFRDHTLVERKIRMKRWLWWILWLLLIVDLSIWIHQVPQRKELFYLSKHGRPVTMKSEALQCQELKWEISSSTVLLLCVCVSVAAQSSCMNPPLSSHAKLWLVVCQNDQWFESTSNHSFWISHCEASSLRIVGFSGLLLPVVLLFALSCGLNPRTDRAIRSCSTRPCECFRLNTHSTVLKI